MEELFTNNKSSIVTSNRILYTPSSFARTSLLHLQEIGGLEARRAHTSSRSNLASFLFFAVVDGAGRLEYGGKEFKLGAGDMAFIDCHNPYSHTTDEKRLWTLRWVHFYGPTLPSIYNKYCERGGRPVFTPEDSAPFFSVFSQLFSTASSADYMRDMKINSSLSELLVLLMSESWHPEDATTAKKKASVADVKEFLDSHYAEKITLDQLSTDFYINKYYLTKVFKEQYGQSITAYLLNVRITKAKQLLRFSEKSVEEIGIEVGLGAPHYFSQTFKSVEGVPPSVYRKQW
jgi:AraC-like DNA-binding protein